MDSPTIAAIVAGVALAVTVADKLFGGGWNLAGKLGSMERRINAARNDMEKRLSDTVSADIAAIDQRQDNVAHGFDETVKALREKINQVELEGGKTFMRRDDFQIFHRELREDLKTNFANVQSSITRLEEKIDKSSR